MPEQESKSRLRELELIQMGYGRGAFQQNLLGATFEGARCIPIALNA